MTTDSPELNHYTTTERSESHSSSKKLELQPTVPLVSFIFPDMRALHRLNIQSSENPPYEVVKIHGFEIYIVEQWTAERSFSTVITSYTGNSQDEITAVRILLPENPEFWPGNFKKYYQELISISQPKIIKNSTLFITNLSVVPSSLYLIHVECGDIREVWENFKVNFNLKRLHCGGRQGLLLNGVSTAALEKFSQLYKIPIKTQNTGSKQRQQQQPNDLQAGIGEDHGLQEGKPAKVSSDVFCAKKHTSPVVELITIIQLSLSYFGLFNFKIHKSGLLCEETKRAIDRWWEIYGKTYMGIAKPRNETTMGPTTVTSIISLVLSCYFKLMVEDCISAKDPFQETEMYSGIYTFQKKNGLAKHHKLLYFDPETLESLFEISAKSSNTDIFKFKRVVKSRVQDMAGKGNFMQLSNDILTSDLDVLVNNIHGGALGLLWKGKGKCVRDLNNGWKKKRFTELDFNHGNLDEVLKKQELYLDKLKIDETILRKQSPEKFKSSDLSPDDPLFQSKNEHDGSGKELQGLKSQNGSNSLLSISSMFCNYDRSKYLRSHDTNVQYQAEFYRRKSYPFINDQTEIAAYQDSIGEYRLNLHRSNSLSEASTAIEIWDLPFDSSVVKMARDLLKVKVRLHKQEQQKTRDKIVNLCDGENAGIEDEKFSSSLHQLHLEFTSCSKKADKFNETQSKLENKHNYLLKEMQELNSLTSKLKYNVRLLNTRMRDVQDSVNEFDNKLNVYRKLLLKQGPNMTLAIETVDNDIEFDKCLRNLIHAEKTKYGGICLRVLRKDFLNQLSKNLFSWSEWLYHKFFYKTEFAEAPTSELYN
ncbi:Stb6p NDAI_0C00410 [Naumovozyma dairenensis CBS 421]|uniref:STB6-like N-terminal domain-containing protein n=1 Tax=Naumovozyma dairenensis (strain ATCC 10597 / BCRC 20456 / CBS 421 / NBRC 0211 / NRRL Y-12639) TaxID=1071378 RepID=G0W7E1_NAUDC|nr:hypothetical protein NDAI_0C00410 [Naumovozyma dairenensis CBS 421]CCD23702.1 hypothetical protein NDAI_0C00410 [Naumovozyma dairenensis CBS 421]